jgi:hypothetical protein
MNGILLEGEALRHAKSVLAMIDDEASFDDLQQFQEEEQVGSAGQQGSGDLLSMTGDLLSMIGDL